jgi:hypothetical protein
MIVPF